MNHLNFLDRIAPIRGYTTLFSINKAGELTSLFYHKNKIMNGSAMATARMWGGYSNFKAGAMYFEFQNLANPGDTPAYPTFTKADGVEYYTGLQYSPDKDFLRVPIMISPNIAQTANGYLLTLYALTPDVDTGYWGKPFAGTNNSVVIGGAVAATPDTSVQANDIILCRNYPVGTKVPKTSGEQIGMTWNVEFEYPQEES